MPSFYLQSSKVSRTKLYKKWFAITRDAIQGIVENLLMQSWSFSVEGGFLFAYQLMYPLSAKRHVFEKISTPTTFLNVPNHFLKVLRNSRNPHIRKENYSNNTKYLHSYESKDRSNQKIYKIYTIGKS